MRDVYVTAVGTAFGEPRDLAALPECANADVERRLRAEGFATWFEAPGPAWPLAAESAAATLAAWDGPEPRLVVYGSESVAHWEDVRRAPAHVASAIELPCADVLAVGGSLCANLPGLLRVARNAVVAGDAENVLVVTADVRLDGARVLDTATTLFSDGAASCVVTSSRPGCGYRLVGFGSATDSALYDTPDGDVVARVRGNVDGVRLALADLTARTGVTPADAKAVVTDNVGATMLGLYVAVGEIDASRVHARAAATGHVFAADLLVNLASLGGVGSGDLVLALASSRARRACVALEVL